MSPKKDPFKSFESETPKEATPEVAVKEEVKEEKEVKKEPKSPAKDPMVILSQTDAYIHERMKGQPESLEDVNIKVESGDPKKHRLSLPPEIEAYKNKFTFRWIFKVKRAIDEACDIRGWTLCNQSYFPDWPNHFFTANGSVERGDNILAFMPNAKAQEIREEPGKRSTEMLTATFEKHKNDPNYYHPKIEGEETTMI